MKLIQIWEARQAWISLNAAYKSNETAYRIAKCIQALAKELATINEVRQTFVRRVVGAKPTVNVSLNEGTDEFKAFEKAFTEFMSETESDFFPFIMNFDDLVDELKSYPENTITEEEISLLGPFFEWTVLKHG